MAPAPVSGFGAFSGLGGSGSGVSSSSSGSGRGTSSHYYQGRKPPHRSGHPHHHHHQEGLWGPIRAEHVLWATGLLLFYFYVWQRLLFSPSPPPPPDVSAHEVSSSSPSQQQKQQQRSRQQQLLEKQGQRSDGIHSGEDASTMLLKAAGVGGQGKVRTRFRRGRKQEEQPGGASGPSGGRDVRGNQRGSGARLLRQQKGDKGGGKGEGGVQGGGGVEIVSGGTREGLPKGPRGRWGRRRPVAREAVENTLGLGNGGGNVDQRDVEVEEEAEAAVTGPPVPHIVERFRAGAVDWHDYVPQPLIAGGDTSQDAAYRDLKAAYELHLLGVAEAKVASFFGGDVFAQWDHGPLLDYSVCGVLSDPCAAHASEDSCVWDAFCAWCPSTRVCISHSNLVDNSSSSGSGGSGGVGGGIACPGLKGVVARDVSAYQQILQEQQQQQQQQHGGEGQGQERWLDAEHRQLLSRQEHGHGRRSKAKMVVRIGKGGSLEHHDLPLPLTPSQSGSDQSHVDGNSIPALCNRIVPGHFQFLTLDYEEMYWHWLLENFVPLLTDLPYARLRDKRTQFILTKPSSSRHLAFLGLLSNSCWRTAGDIAEGTCLVVETADDEFKYKMEHAHLMTAATDVVDRRVAPFVLARLNLTHLEPPSEPTVLFLVRRRRRFILNEVELQQRLRYVLGLRHVTVACFEGMPLHAQLRLVRSAAILVGMHGSGLLNAMFLHRGSVLVHVVPFDLPGGIAARFYEPHARQAGAEYLELKAVGASSPGLDLKPQPTNTQAGADGVKGTSGNSISGNSSSSTGGGGGAGEGQGVNVLHWHLAEDVGAKVGTLEERAALLAHGPDLRRDSQLFFRFWVNQDVHIDPDHFEAVMAEAVQRWKERRPAAEVGGDGDGRHDETTGHHASRAESAQREDSPGMQKEVRGFSGWRRRHVKA